MLGISIARFEVGTLLFSPKNSVVTIFMPAYVQKLRHRGPII